jgi:hypothetical protein
VKERLAAVLVGTGQARWPTRYLHPCWDRLPRGVHHLLDQGHGRVRLLERNWFGLAVGYWLATLLT